MLRTEDLGNGVKIPAGKIHTGGAGVDGGPVAEANRFPVGDRFSAGQVLADQAGAGAALTFTFSAPVDLIWVRSDGGISRADPFGGTPTASLGIQCDDGIPVPITVTATTIKIYAPNSATVKVYGYRY